MPITNIFMTYVETLLFVLKHHYFELLTPTNTGQRPEYGYLIDI